MPGTTGSVPQNQLDVATAGASDALRIEQLRQKASREAEREALIAKIEPDLEAARIESNKPTYKRKIEAIRAFFAGGLFALLATLNIFFRDEASKETLFVKPVPGIGDPRVTLGFIFFRVFLVFTVIDWFVDLWDLWNAPNRNFGRISKFALSTFMLAVQVTLLILTFTLAATAFAAVAPILFILAVGLVGAKDLFLFIFGSWRQHKNAPAGSPERAYFEKCRMQYGLGALVGIVAGLGVFFLMINPVGALATILISLGSSAFFGATAAYLHGLGKGWSPIKTRVATALSALLFLGIAALMVSGFGAPVIFVASMIAATIAGAATLIYLGLAIYRFFAKPAAVMKPSLAKTDLRTLLPSPNSANALEVPASTPAPISTSGPAAGVAAAVTDGKTSSLYPLAPLLTSVPSVGVRHENKGNAKGEQQGEDKALSMKPHQHQGYGYHARPPMSLAGRLRKANIKLNNADGSKNADGIKKFLIAEMSELCKEYSKKSGQELSKGNVDGLIKLDEKAAAERKQLQENHYGYGKNFFKNYPAGSGEGYTIAALHVANQQAATHGKKILALEILTGLVENPANFCTKFGITFGSGEGQISDFDALINSPNLQPIFKGVRQSFWKSLGGMEEIMNLVKDYANEHIFEPATPAPSASVTVPAAEQQPQHVAQPPSLAGH